VAVKTKGKPGSMLKISVREVNFDDLQDLHPIYNSENRKHPLNKYPLTEWIVGPTIFLLAETQKSKVGFIVVRQKGEEGSIDLLCVKRGFKKADIEKELVKSASHILSNRIITIRIPLKSKDKIKRFKEMGFKIIEEFKTETPGHSFAILSIKYAPKPRNLKIMKPVRKHHKNKKTLKENLKKLEKHLEYEDYFGKDMLS